MQPATHAVDSVSTVAPATPAVSTAAALAATPAQAASAVNFSGLAQFLATVSLTRRQLEQLQGATTSTPTAAELMLLNVAATNLTQAFNQLPPSALDTLPPLPDSRGGTLGERLALVLQQLGATAGRGGPLSSSTLAGAGITLDPLAPASSADMLNVAAPVLRAAFAADRDGTLALLARTADAFNTLGTAVAQAQAAAPLLTPAPAMPPSVSPASNAALANLALNEALAATQAASGRQPSPLPAQPSSTPVRGDALAATPAERQRQQQLAVAREAAATASAQPETQADRLAAERAASERQLTVSAQEDLAATALAQRMAAQQRAATSRQDDATAQRQADLTQRTAAAMAAAQRAAEQRLALPPSAMQQQQLRDAAAAARQARQELQAQQDQTALAAQAARDRQAANTPRPPNAADPAQAAAIAAYHMPGMAAAGARPPVIPAPVEKVPTTAPVSKARPVLPAGDPNSTATRK